MFDLSLIYLSDENLTNTYLDPLGYNYASIGYNFRQSLYIFFFILKLNLIGYKPLFFSDII